MGKEIYENAEIKVTEFEAEDVIATSNGYQQPSMGPNDTEIL